MKKQLIYTNEIPMQFERHKEYIEEIISDFFDDFEFDCKIEISFKEKGDVNFFETTDCMLKNLSATKHELIITNALLKTIDWDGGNMFCCAIYHEMEHIRDYINTTQTKLFHFNIGLARQKDFEKQYVAVGHMFWTEFYAYYKTFVFAKLNDIPFQNVTFSNLVCCFKQTLELNKQLYYKQDLSRQEGLDYIKTVNSFLYMCAKFLASFVVRRSYLPHKKIENDKTYKKVFSIICGFMPKIKRLFLHPYNDKFYDNMFKLGKYICENVRWKIFKVGVTKHKGRISTFY